LGKGIGMKQTAVEFLEDKLSQVLDWDLLELFQQAKAMEKEHIGRAYQEGLIDGMNHTPKDYYNETFNTEEK
jgi:rubrerythrin